MSRRIADLAAAHKAIDDFIGPRPEPREALIAAKCRGLMIGYHARWSGADFRPTAIESTTRATLFNPETHHPSRTFTVAGKLDVIGFQGDRLILMDHKTCSEDIEDPNSTYWRQLIVESQLSHYMLLEWINGRKLDGGLWDVIRKPSISPKLLSKKDFESVTFLKKYMGQPISEESIAALHAEARETPEMYAMRLAIDCTEARPHWYFQRRFFPRLDMELHEQAKELWDHSQEIIQARRHNRWPRNSRACMLYGSPCKFLGICSGHDELDSSNWRLKSQVHNELQLEGDGRDVLTNSRIGSFQTCRRKHFYEYELGIQRVEEDEKESLYFGECIHAALAAWFLSQQSDEQQKGEYGNNDADSSDSEFETASIH
jgi:hypothetical protein